MAAGKDERELRITPIHRPIMAGLTRVLKDEIGHSVLLTFEDSGYDAFKMDEGQRAGPWCSLRPTEFEISDGAQGRGLSTATRPNVWSAGIDTEMLQSQWMSMGSWTRVAGVDAVAAGPVDGGHPPIHAALSDGTGGRFDLVVRKVDLEDLGITAVRDMLSLTEAGEELGSLLVVRALTLEPHLDSGVMLIRYAVSNADGDNDQLADLLPPAGRELVILRRRAEMIKLLMVPVVMRFTLRYLTTDVQELMDFFADWAFMRAKSRLDFNLRYLGSTVPIKVVLGSSLSVPTKELPGDEGGYQAFEGDIEAHGFLTHGDTRDAAIEPRIVDVDASVAPGWLPASEGSQYPLRGA